MPEMNGYETTTWIKKHHPTIPVLAFTDLEEPKAIEAIIECGADGYTSKTRCSISGRLVKVITQIVGGKGYYDNEEVYNQVKARMKTEAIKCKVGINALSAAEMKVLRSLPSEKTPMEQADEIHLSVHTYNNHIKSITAKLSVKTSKTLMKFAYSLGLIEL